MKLRNLLFIICLITFNQFQAQGVGEISGIIEDEMGFPIPGVSVYLEGSEIGTLTDLDGRYLISDVDPGSYNLVASILGYETTIRYNIIVRSKGMPSYDFTLKSTTEVLDEVVISTANSSKRTRETPLSIQSISGDEIATYPGGNNDVVQVMQTFPGVSPSVGGFRNDLIIRGGAPNETVYYLDGMEVTNINHFSTQGSSGGPVGMINVSFIDEVTLSSSAFESQYNNPLSGVMQFNQRIGNQKEFSGNFRIGASEAALTIEGPLFKGDNENGNTSFIASVRRSYLQFLFDLIGLPFRPDYWDYQFKLNHDIDDRNSLHLLGLGSIDDFTLKPPDEFDEEQQAQLEQAPFIVQRSNNIGITWKNRFKNGRGFMESTLSNHILSNDFKRYQDSENETGLLFNNDSRENETKFRFQLTRFFNDWKFSAGFNSQYASYINNTIDLTNDYNYNTEIDFVCYGMNIQVTRSLLDGDLDLSFGFRMDDDSFTIGNDLFSTFSPRASLSFEFIDDWKINASAGRYFKIPPYTILGFRNLNDDLLNKDVNYTQSDHLVLGLQHILSNSSYASLESFYKKYDDYPVSVIDRVSLANKGGGFEVLGNEEVMSVGQGRSYGMEFLFQQKLSKNFYGIFSYTWFKSEFTGFDNHKYLPSVWDSRHLISFTGGYKLSKQWEISSRFRFAGKTPFVPTDLDATLENYPDIILDYDRLGEQNLDVFSQLDLRIDKKWNFKNMALGLYIDIQNVLAQEIPQTPDYGLNRNSDGTIIEPRSLVEIQNDSGTVIPSIGIIWDF
jgi:outer membrane receptor for ferrienterochelin and colicin